ncbi:MAG: translocation/assembly module TamB domain-containing protein [Bryobacteraceae bacterium]
MRRRLRWLWIALGGLTALALVVAVTGVLILRSDWFRDKVRRRIVAEVEKATGGRADIESFYFDWGHMQARVDRLVLHGTEPPDAPPLFQAKSVEIGIKIISVLRSDVDIRSLQVTSPQVNLIVYPDGRTNVPSPKVKHAGKGTVETILDLAIDRFDLTDGNLAIQGKGKTPFEARGRNLRAQFTYDPMAPRYQGRISIAPAEFRWPDHRSLPLDVAVALALEKNRVQIDSGRVATQQSQAEFSGVVENLADPLVSLQYTVRAALADVVRTLDWRTQLEGPVQLSGLLRFRSTSDFLATGTLRANGLYFRPDPHFTLRNFTAEGVTTVNPRQVEVSAMRIAGLASAAIVGDKRAQEQIPLKGRMEKVVLRQKVLTASGIHIDQLGGAFSGKAEILDFDQLSVEGDISSFDVQQMLRVYNGQTVPWDAAASGPVQLSVSLRRGTNLQLAGHVAISPAGPGPSVHGSIDASYDGPHATLDLGRSFLALPSTRVDFSGVLGRQLQVRVDSRNLNDVLPAFNVTSIPVSLQNGEAHFAGSVVGELDDPHIDGHGSATNVQWGGKVFDAVSGDVDVTRHAVAVRNGTLHRASLQLQGAGSVGMQDWKVEGNSPVSASGSIRNTAVVDMMSVADIQDFPMEGAVNAEGKISGTVGEPRVEASCAVAKGAIDGEPFDSVTGSITYADHSLVLTNGRVVAGPKDVTLTTNYQHQPGSFGSGRLRFQLDTNAMPVTEIRRIVDEVRGLGGNLEAHATGLVDFAPARAGEPGFRVISLNGSVRGRGLSINDEPLHDFDLTANTKANELRAHLESEVAGSIIQGDGHWALAGDYSGSAQFTFKGLDLARLPEWAGKGKLPGGIVLTGSAEGSLTIDGPAIKRAEWKASLRIPNLHVGPGGDLAAKGNALALHNPVPIVASMERNIIKIESARLAGRATDLALSGTVNLDQKSSLDLRVSGAFDLATLQDFDRDIYSAGSMETGVTIRGPLNQPLVTGRLNIKDATFNLSDIPVGVYKANGVILFDGSRATIQSFSGESGGGTVRLSGFAGYGGETLVFRLHANAADVRVRYPEDFSTVANASLNLTGATDSSMLSGRVTILRTGFNPHSDFSSVLAKSAEPVRTPSAQTGFLANMHFDVQVESAPNITFQSSLAQGLQAAASLRLRGTGSNPSLLGRINITQGQIVFFGTQFTVNQGSIAFYNPVKIEPVLNVDLETKARGVDVILNISGPINKLNLTPRSDPPLQFNEILALLATGRSPTSDYATLMSSPAAPQSLQSLGASALLGQAIASPVTGRLQRFFGVTRLKIDPTLTSLTGVANNPQARLTIEQQVTPDITFTYITDVTSTNPLVVRVEWAFSRNWSVVALREENGLVGMEFLYKRRF